MDLFDLLPSDHRERCEAFLREHPDVWEMFVKIALDLKRAGHRRYSSDGICHVIRWHRSTSGKDVTGFKMNDHFTAYLSRRAMEEVRELEGFFETRKVRS